MFADALLDSHHQSRRGWATLTSFGLQAIFIACLLIIPLLYTQVLPQMRSTPRLIARFGDNLPEPAAPAQPAHGGASVNPTPHIILLTQPPRIPVITSGPETEAPNLPLGSTGPFGNGPGLPDGVRNALDTVAVRVSPPPPTVTVRAPRVSAMMEGSLIHRVEPVYPAMAKNVRIQGTVMLMAIIGKDGTVQNLQVVSGHPMLARAALDAVRQWRYRPYILNGSPIEVDTQISVNFRLTQ